MKGLLGVALLGLVLVAGFVVVVSGGRDPETATGFGVGTGLKPGTVPARYRQLVLQAAQRCPQVTAPLIAAQIEAESGWNPHAVSVDNAQGLGQFIPSTWRYAGVDGNGDGVRNPFDPADAIPSVAAHMCHLVDQVTAHNIPGNVIDNALAAYNAGLGAVIRYQGIPPYEQTQDYVAKIRRLAAQYAAQPDPVVLAAGSSGWVLPVRGADFTSGFGSRWGSVHGGIDLAAPIGTPVRAAAAGTVIEAGPASGFGLWVRIRHAGGLTTVYGYVHTITVQPGQHVSAGQQIATVGSRGQSTGPHLHFEVHTADGQALDPQAFLVQRGISVTEAP